MGAMGYSEVERVDYFAAPTASAALKKVAAMVCKQEWGLRHLDVDQAFIQSRSWTPMSTCACSPVCESVSSKVVRLNDVLYGLKRNDRAWY